MEAADRTLSSVRQGGGASWNINSNTSWYFLSTYYIPDVILSLFVSMDSSFTLHNSSVSEVPLLSPFFRWRIWRWDRDRSKFTEPAYLDLVHSDSKNRNPAFWFGTGGGQWLKGFLGWGSRWFTWPKLVSTQIFFSGSFFFLFCTHWQDFLLFSLCLFFWFTPHLLVGSGFCECDAEDRVSCGGGEVDTKG